MKTGGKPQLQPHSNKAKPKATIDKELVDQSLYSTVKFTLEIQASNTYNKSIDGTDTNHLISNLA